ncbi:MAG: hypothetical protein ACFB0B_11105 [Thermonemataceae bacterium]
MVNLLFWLWLLFNVPDHTNQERSPEPPTPPPVQPNKIGGGDWA